MIVHGYDLGMNASGGFSEYIRVPSEWGVPLAGWAFHARGHVCGNHGVYSGIVWFGDD